MLPLIRKGTVALAAVASLISLPAPAQAETAWTPDLSAIDGDDVNVAYDGHALRLRDNRTGPAALDGAVASGQLLLAPKDLPEPVNRVSARVSGAGTVEVRAHLGGTNWTEWYPAGQTLPASSTRIQVRVVLSATPGGTSPTVTSVRLTGDQVAERRISAAAAQTYRVYATREGLVGGTTANGHVITNRDHFVALPSRRGLSANNAGEYTVRVCTTTGSRCEYAPVWDVGPWNTRDDYWNPSSIRQMWKDLPQGKPEAQAAYQDGYNGGKDEFGRTVANPAGIDLADGTFWDGLKLTDNAWVNVTYLWTGTGPKGVVRTNGTPLNVRSSASTSSSIVGLAANYANVIVECHVRGQTVTGTYGTSDIWNRIGPGHFVPDVYLYTGSDNPVAPAC